MKGILGRKAGMTQIFTEEGKMIPVTVIEVKPNTVLETKTEEKHGYSSVKLGYEDKKDNKANKAELGIAKKANTSAKYFIKEIRNMEGFEQGQSVEGSIFEAGEFVDITGTSKGKGFQGAIKRHNQSRGPMGHGSKSHRVTGSLGDIRGTVKKTKKMPGHMGHVKVTAQNLEVVAVDTENNAILVKGSIPGPNKSFVVIKSAVKIQEATEAQKLVNIKEAIEKNTLIEEGKKLELTLTAEMDVKEMKNMISEAKAKIAEEKAAKEAEAKAAKEEVKEEAAPAEEAKTEEVVEETKEEVKEEVKEEAAPAEEAKTEEETSEEKSEEVK